MPDLAANKCKANGTLTPSELRDAFSIWLSDGNSRKFPPSILIASIDKISLYAIKKKASDVSLWEISQYDAFALVYNRLLGMKLLRIMNKNTYKVFTVAGRLYMQFLKKSYASSGKSKELSAMKYAPQTNPLPEKSSTNATDADSCAVAQSSTGGTSDTQIIEKLTQILVKKFSNGYRLNSPIESARFRSFALEILGEDLRLPDDELQFLISSCGITYDGKVYVVSTETKGRVRDLAEKYFATGAQAIFFAEFYHKNENWLFEAGVISEDMLIDIFRRLFPASSFTQTYFGSINASIFAALESEILRVWGNDNLLTYEQLANRLHYIPIDRIKYALAQSGDFIWNSVETFSHISRIEITCDEKEAIHSAAVRSCNAQGYVSITEIPLNEIEQRNCELSIAAVHNAVYRICLSDKFDKKGKIITRKGDSFDALTIMKEYCKKIDKCSLSDLLHYEKELTGEIHRWTPMEAGNAVLVRIDKDTYIADKYVHFDSDAVDEAIGLFVTGDYLPLQSFTTFGAFPECGQTWNLFLLESFCRRFSRRFRFDTPSVNSRNAGAVIRKSCEMSYTEIMTDVIANSNVELNEASIGRFLCDNGYTGRGTTAKAGEIIKKAKSIRERGK